MRRVTMSELDDRHEAVRAWREKGDDDLRSARILLEADPPLTDIVCFHSQQAAEKYLKSFLVHHDVDPPYTHDLTTLSLCVQHDGSLDAFHEEAAVLTSFAVHARYPTPEEPTDLQMATSALQAADAICEAVRARLQEMK